MKYEWRKVEKSLYGVKASAKVVDVPQQSFIMLDGTGNPNLPGFTEEVSALYALAYAIKMDYKKSHTNQEIQDFTVYPLEGIWQQKEQGELVKEELIYTIMIAQPSFISKEMVKEALEKVKEKLVDLGYDPKMGARPLRRTIQDYIEDAITDFYLENPNEKDLKAVMTSKGHITIKSAKKVEKTAQETETTKESD